MIQNFGDWSQKFWIFLWYIYFSIDTLPSGLFCAHRRSIFIFVSEHTHLSHHQTRLCLLKFIT
jgi:hypothetical protein